MTSRVTCGVAGVMTCIVAGRITGARFAGTLAARSSWRETSVEAGRRPHEIGIGRRKPLRHGHVFVTC
ncbi:MAG: hypothetical protein LLF89_07675, partial [Spirochaetaceae bacterium]|nr:hypothetical protein [Spirochaetaceae bacterium]